MKKSTEKKITRREILKLVGMWKGRMKSGAGGGRKV